VLDRGRPAALTTRRARILLDAEDRPGRRVRSDVQVAALSAVSARTVVRVRAAFATEGFAVALHGRPHPGAAPKPSADQELRLITLACSAPPAGQARWSVRLLAERVVALEAMPDIGRELVRTTLKKPGLKKPGSSPGGCGGG